MKIKILLFCALSFLVGCSEGGHMVKIGHNIDDIFWLKAGSAHCPELGILQKHREAENRGEPWVTGTPCGRIRGNIAVKSQTKNRVLGPYELVRFLGPNRHFGLQWVRREDLQRPHLYYERKLYENE